ncbi:MAG: hypothetical protein CM15mV101_180 [uncultured marine virus]|nr:MAG: hypothetical protein CM15mV101_180 [uncultured marine virus]
MASWDKEEWLKRTQNNCMKMVLIGKTLVFKHKRPFDNGDMEEPINYEEEV